MPFPLHRKPLLKLFACTLSRHKPIFCTVEAVIPTDSPVGDRHLLGWRCVFGGGRGGGGFGRRGSCLLCMFIWGFPGDLNWFQLRGDVREEAKGGSKLEGRQVRSGWLATCPDDISKFMCVWLCVLLWVGVSVREEDGVCVCVCAWVTEV